MSDLTYAWHFVGDTLRDGRPIPPDGEWLEHTGEVEMCVAGLHASERLIDALKYAPGATICRVECKGIVARVADKLVCRRRRIKWRVDGEDLLRDFARRCAWSVLDLWEPPQIVVDYLRSGDVSLRAAARDAAWNAAWDAARAARAAARAAAWDAAWDVAWDVAWDAQDEWLTEMVEQAHAGTYAKWTADNS